MWTQIGERLCPPTLAKVPLAQAQIGRVTRKRVKAGRDSANYDIPIKGIHPVYGKIREDKVQIGIILKCLNLNNTTSFTNLMVYETFPTCQGQYFFLPQIVISCVFKSVSPYDMGKYYLAH